MNLLEIIGTFPLGITPYELCRMMQMKKSTVHNLLRTMTQQGFIERLTGPVRFRLGAVGLRLDRPHSECLFLQKAGEQIIRLSRQLDSDVFLGEPVGGMVLMILAARPNMQRPLELPYASEIKPYGTGLAYQAFCSDEERRVYQARNVQLLNGTTWTQRRLAWALSAIKKRGALVIRRNGCGHYRIAVPIIDPRGRVHAVLCLSRYRQSMPIAVQNNYMKCMFQSAKELIRILHTHPPIPIPMSCQC